MYDSRVERKEAQKSILDASETETAVEITRAASPTAAEKDILVSTCQM